MGCLQLWDGWSIVETIEDVVRPCGLVVARFGVTARSDDGVLVCGSAAATSGDVAARGHGELRERAAIIDALRVPTDTVTLVDREHRTRTVADWATVYPESPTPGHWGYSKSNGVALSTTWSGACDRAATELIERDRVLRSWFGLPGAPSRRTLSTRDSGRLPGYEWKYLELVDEGSETHVVVVVGFPQVEGLPLVRGFGAGASAREAAERADQECLQSIGFLGASDVPEDEPAVAPNPTYHLDAYLWPGAVVSLRRWMDPSTDALRRPAVRRELLRREAIAYVDITPKPLEGAAFVAKAVCVDAVPLVFGDSHPDLLGPQVGVPVHPLA